MANVFISHAGATTPDSSPATGHTHRGRAVGAGAAGHRAHRPSHRHADRICVRSVRCRPALSRRDVPALHPQPRTPRPTDRPVGVPIEYAQGGRILAVR